MEVLRNILAPAALSVLLTGCYEDFNPDIDVAPVLAINSLITAGEPIDVEVTHTWIYNECLPYDTDLSVDDAVVSIYANGRPAGEDYIPQEGDRIRVVADSRKYGSAEAEVTVPHAVRDAKIDWHASLLSDLLTDDNYAMSAHMNFNVYINLTLEDKHETADFFRLSYSGFLPDVESDNDDELFDPPRFYTGTLDEKFEPLFSEHISVFESLMGTEAYGFSFFTDRRFAGSAYTLCLKFDNAGYHVRTALYDEALLSCGYVLELQSVSQSYYDWENYKWQMENGVTGDIIDFGFGDPMWGYSNVSTGAGVVAARSVSTFRINLADFLRSAIKPS